jgi:hypothetical protein
MCIVYTALMPAVCTILTSTCLHTDICCLYSTDTYCLYNLDRVYTTLKPALCTALMPADYRILMPVLWQHTREELELSPSPFPAR